MQIFKHICLLFFIIFLSSGSLSAAENLSVYKYPEPIKNHLKEVKKDFNITNIEKLYTEFIKYKGIDDPLIAYSLVETALDNTDKINENIIKEIEKFAPSQSNKISAILTEGFFNKIIHSFEYINMHILLSLTKHILTILLFLLILYFGLRNSHIFLHSHSNTKKLAGLIKFAVFIGLFTTMLIIIPGKTPVILASLLMIVIVSEEPVGRALSIAIAVATVVIFSLSVDIDSENNTLKYRDTALKPFSKEYLAKLKNKHKNNKLLQSIIFLKSDSKTVSPSEYSSPKNYNEAVNFASLYLAEGNTAQFNRIVENYSLSNNPVILMNMNSFFMKNFMYEDYESYIENLYNHPVYHNVFQAYQIKFGKTAYFPYYPNKPVLKQKLNFDWFSFLISMSIFFVFLIAHILISRLNLFRCRNCGETFCGNCDDGFHNNDVCSLCSNINSHRDNADPAIMVRKNVQASRYKHINSRNIFFLTLFLPGSGLIYRGSFILGLLLTALFAKSIFFLIFKFEIFVWPLNLGIQYVMTPVVITIICVFTILYIASFFYKRD